MSQIKLQAASYHTPDKRLQETQHRLFAALRKAFEVKQNFNTITVSALCKSAQIARQTFYRHYANLGEIIQLNMAWIINSFLQQTDQKNDSTRFAPHLMVNLMEENRTSLAMIFWAHEEQNVTQYLVNDMRRINAIYTTNNSEDAFTIELYARMVMSFAQLMIEQPGLDQAPLIELYQKLMPTPETIFHQE